MRRTGLAPGTEDERDPARCGSRSRRSGRCCRCVEQAAPPQAAPIRDALSQLQLAFVRIGGAAAEAAAAGAGGRPATRARRGEPARPARRTRRRHRPGGPRGQAPPRSPSPTPPKPGEPGPAQRSGRLWVPGQ